MTKAAHAIRTLRFRLWILTTTARLRRHGVTTLIEAGGTPRFSTTPRLEIDQHGRGGSLTITLGEHNRLGRDLIIEFRTGTHSTLTLGDRSDLGAFCRVQLHGGIVQLDDDVNVRDLVLLKCRSWITVGDRTVLSRGVNVHATAGVDIGPECGIGERTSIIDSDHTADGSAEHHLDRPLKQAPISIGRNVAVSANVVILRGTTIGDNAVVAAGAVVNGGEFPAGHLIGGVPATVLRELRPAG